MCNLYACNKQRHAVMMRFGLAENRTAQFEPKAAIFPGYEAPVIRVAEDGERTLENMVWGFVRRPPNRAPSRVSNVRNDTVLTNRFWTSSFRERRCLVPATSYCEPTGSKPSVWHWHALLPPDERPLFAFPGIWRDYTGPVKKDGEAVTQRVFAFMTCGPNDLPTAVEHERMPVVLDNDEQFDVWLNGSEEQALKLAKPYPESKMSIIQSGAERRDLAGATA